MTPREGGSSHQIRIPHREVHTLGKGHEIHRRIEGPGHHNQIIGFGCHLESAANEPRLPDLVPVEPQLLDLAAGLGRQPAREMDEQIKGSGMAVIPHQIGPPQPLAVGAETA